MDENSSYELSERMEMQRDEWETKIDQLEAKLARVCLRNQNESPLDCQRVFSPRCRPVLNRFHEEI